MYLHFDLMISPRSDAGVFITCYSVKSANYTTAYLYALSVQAALNV